MRRVPQNRSLATHGCGVDIHTYDQGIPLTMLYSSYINFIMILKLQNFRALTLWFLISFICSVLGRLSNDSQINAPDDTTNAGLSSSWTNGAGNVANLKLPARSNGGSGKAGLAWPNGNSADYTQYTTTGKVSWSVQQYNYMYSYLTNPCHDTSLI